MLLPHPSPLPMASRAFLVVHTDLAVIPPSWWVLEITGPLEESPKFHNFASLLPNSPLWSYSVLLTPHEGFIVYQEVLTLIPPFYQCSKTREPHKSFTIQALFLAQIPFILSLPQQNHLIVHQLIKTFVQQFPAQLVLQFTVRSTHLWVSWLPLGFQQCVTNHLLRLIDDQHLIVSFNVENLGHQ